MENEISGCRCCGKVRDLKEVALSGRLTMCPECLVALDRFTAAALGAVIIRGPHGGRDGVASEGLAESAINVAEATMVERKRRLGV